MPTVSLRQSAGYNGETMPSCHAAESQTNLGNTFTSPQVTFSKKKLKHCFLGISSHAWNKGSVASLLPCDNLLSQPSSGQRVQCSYKNLQNTTIPQYS